jgi:hypothetical protein
LFRRGYEIYRTLPTGLYGLSHDDPKREAARHRAIASLGHLVEHIHEVPIHVIPCVEGSLDGPPIVAAVTMGSVVPVAWSFIGLPPGVMQVGTDFKPAHRRPLDEIVHYDCW